MSSRSPRGTRSAKHSPDFHELQEHLLLGDLFFEKGALDKSHSAFTDALKLARKLKDWPAAAEALTGLVRLANEGLDDAAADACAREAKKIRGAAGASTPPMLLYCEGAIARHRKQIIEAQQLFHRYVREARDEKRSPDSARLLSREDELARGWAMVAVMAFQRGLFQRARHVANTLLRHLEAKRLKKINGNLHLLLGKMAEREGTLEVALGHYQKAHAAFLAEHNWYYHLHVLYGYARIARLQQNYSQAYWYLDLVDQAASSPGFASMKREVRTERGRLQQSAVDLLIDSRKGLVKIRDGQSVSLRKQWVLLNILEALSKAHELGGEEGRGLSKAEIINAVWREPYRPEAHDNKLYYNINRLRKLIEPDMKSPKYLLNWREGYRLAPGLRVQRLGSVEN